jgi:hypothetical protein
MLDRSSKVDDAFARLGIGLPDPQEPPPHDHIPEGADGEPVFEAMNGTATVQRFVPVAIDQVTISAEPPWLIDGLLPARGLLASSGRRSLGRAS